MNVNLLKQFSICSLGLESCCSANREITVLKFRRWLKGSQAEADICMYVALRLRSCPVKILSKGKKRSFGVIF